MVTNLTHPCVVIITDPIPTFICSKVTSQGLGYSLTDIQHDLQHFSYSFHDLTSQWLGWSLIEILKSLQSFISTDPKCIGC